MYCCRYCHRHPCWSGRHIAAKNPSSSKQSTRLLDDAIQHENMQTYQIIGKLLLLFFLIIQTDLSLSVSPSQLISFILLGRNEIQV